MSKYCPSIYKACMDKSGEEYEFQKQNPKLKRSLERFCGLLWNRLFVRLGKKIVISMDSLRTTYNSYSFCLYVTKLPAGYSAWGHQELDTTEWLSVARLRLLEECIIILAKQLTLGITEDKMKKRIQKIKIIGRLMNGWRPLRGSLTNGLIINQVEEF